MHNGSRLEPNSKLVHSSSNTSIFSKSSSNSKPSTIVTSESTVSFKTKTFENPINYGLKNSNIPLLSTSNLSIQEQNYQSKYNQNQYLALDYSSLNLNRTLNRSIKPSPSLQDQFDLQQKAKQPRSKSSYIASNSNYESSSLYSYKLNRINDSQSIRSSFNGSNLTLSDSIETIIQKSNNFHILDRLNQKQQMKIKKQLELKQQEENEKKLIESQLKQLEQKRLELSDYNSKIQSHYSIIDKTNQIGNQIKYNQAQLLHQQKMMPKFQLQFHQLQKIEQNNNNKFTVAQCGVSTLNKNVSLS